MPKILPILLLFLLTVAAARAADGQEQALTLPSGTKLVSQRYAATGEVLVLWMTGQNGRVEAEHRAAADLAARGMEVWVTDWLEPYFLPQLPSSVARVPDADLADWLQMMLLRNPGRRLLLLASDHSTAWPLRAAWQWRQRHGDSLPAAFSGALLLWPLLYREPEPGEDPEYDPVVQQTRMPLTILIPGLSAGYWWRERMQAAFAAAGSRVRLEILPGLRDGFHWREDADALERAAAERLSVLLAPHLRDLSREDRP
ncbi:MAG: hypothetical protein MUC79_03370 [Thiobacillaceae bacterium]|jgi:hypothetical protein|nr:hypothetical protein [Thiobacillaceae bacterium]